MKNILPYKVFESIDINYHMLVVKDIFQDVIDEYNMQSTGWLSGIPTYKMNKTMHGYAVQHNVQITLEFIFWNVDSVIFDKAMKEILPSLKRLEAMGYRLLQDNSNSAWNDRFVVYIDCSQV